MIRELEGLHLAVAELTETPLRTTARRRAGIAKAAAWPGELRLLGCDAPDHV